MKRQLQLIALVLVIIGLMGLMGCTTPPTESATRLDTALKIQDYADYRFDYPTYTAEESHGLFREVLEGRRVVSTHQLCGMWLASRNKGNSIRFWLQQRHDPDLIPFYAALLARSMEHDTFAIEGLVHIPDRRAVEILIDYLEDQEHGSRHLYMKQRVGSNLAKTYTGPGDPFAMIQERLTREGLSEDAICGLLGALGRYGMILDRRVDEAVVARYVEDHRLRVRALAAQDLALSGNFAALAAVVPDLDGQTHSPQDFALECVWRVKTRIPNWTRAHKAATFSYDAALTYVEQAIAKTEISQ